MKSLACLRAPFVSRLTEELSLDRPATVKGKVGALASIQFEVVPFRKFIHIGLTIVGTAISIEPSFVVTAREVERLIQSGFNHETTYVRWLFQKHFTNSLGNPQFWRLSNEADIGTIVEEFKDYSASQAFPFFDLCSSIESVLQEMILRPGRFVAAAGNLWEFAVIAACFAHLSNKRLGIEKPMLDRILGAVASIGGGNADVSYARDIIKKILVTDVENEPSRLAQ